MSLVLNFHSSSNNFFAQRFLPREGSRIKFLQSDTNLNHVRNPSRYGKNQNCSLFQAETRIFAHSPLGESVWWSSKPELVSKRRMEHRRNSVEDCPNNRFVKRVASRTQARNPRGHVVILRVPSKTTPFLSKNFVDSLVHNSIETKRFKTLDDNQSFLSFLSFFYIYINKYSKLNKHPRMEGIMDERWSINLFDIRSSYDHHT